MTGRGVRPPSQQRTGNTPARPRRRYLKILAAVVGSVLFILLTLPLAVLLAISSSASIVEKTEVVDANSAGRVKEAAKQIYVELTRPTTTQPAKITLTEDELNDAIALTMRGIERLRGRINLSPVGIKGAFSIHLPENPFGHYINILVDILPSNHGLVVERVSVGHIDIPGRLAVALLESGINGSLDGTQGTALLQTIQSLQVQDSKLILTYQPSTQFRTALDQAKERARSIRNELGLLGDPQTVRSYYKELCAFHRRVGGITDISLGYYLSTALSLAEQRTLAGQSAQDENRAAILALAIYLGSANFDSALGAIDPQTYQQCPPPDAGVVLANRDDLRLHFIFSAALKTMSDSGISFAIGEFKELLDSQTGGSGFSYVDLTADRSGIRFAELALSANGARHLQQQAHELTREALFFPAIDALPEGIPQATFEQQGGIEGDYYQHHLTIINERINGLPLYQGR